MANNSSVQGSVTLRKLRTGATASISLSSSMQLFQLYEEDSAGNVTSVAPDWSGGNTHPTVSVNAGSSSGSIQILDVDWTIDGQLATAIAGITKGGSATGYALEINANLADSTHKISRTIVASITFKDESGRTSTIEKSDSIRIQKATENGYNTMINANRTWVDETNNATLEGVCYRGLSNVSGSVTFVWYNSTDRTDAHKVGTGPTLTVTPAMVNGSQLFVCVAYDSQSRELDAEGINISDKSDAYVINALVKQFKNNVQQGTDQNNVTSVNVGSDNDKSTIVFSVASQDGTPYAGTPQSWEAWKYHADTMKLIESTAGGNTKDTTTEDSYNHTTANASKTISMDVFDKDYISIGDGTATAHDTEVVVTADANL